MPQEPENPDSGVADYFERHGIDVGSMLIARAPDVIILARLKGAPKTAGYFSEILKVAVTEKHIKGIKLGVKTRRIHVTEEELINAALEAWRILLPGKIVQKDAHGVHADALSPA